MARNYKRDRRGRFAKVAGIKVPKSPSAAKQVARAGVKSGARRVGAGVRKSYVRGSFERNLEVGQGGDYKGVKIGAEFRTPKGRGAVVKGIAGYHGKPDRKLDVTPRLDRSRRELTVTIRPNRSQSAGSKASAGSSGRNAARRSGATQSGAGKKVRR